MNSQRSTPVRKMNDSLVDISLSMQGYIDELRTSSNLLPIPSAENSYCYSALYKNIREVVDKLRQQFQGDVNSEQEGRLQNMNKSDLSTTFEHLSELLSLQFQMAGLENGGTEMVESASRSRLFYYEEPSDFNPSPDVLAHFIETGSLLDRNYGASDSSYLDNMGFTPIKSFNGEDSASIRYLQTPLSATARVAFAGMNSQSNCEFSPTPYKTLAAFDKILTDRKKISMCLEEEKRRYKSLENDSYAMQKLLEKRLSDVSREKDEQIDVLRQKLESNSLNFVFSDSQNDSLLEQEVRLLDELKLSQVSVEAKEFHAQKTQFEFNIAFLKSELHEKHENLSALKSLIAEKDLYISQLHREKLSDEQVLRNAGTSLSLLKSREENLQIEIKTLQDKIASNEKDYKSIVKKSEIETTIFQEPRKNRYLHPL